MKYLVPTIYKVILSSSRIALLHGNTGVDGFAIGAYVLVPFTMWPARLSAEMRGVLLAYAEQSDIRTTVIHRRSQGSESSPRKRSRGAHFRSRSY